ncbi:hypothetical protein ACQEVZ_24610 [Dactylosporangium sp. CA-152071]|uniref:hypothetical protein n=1 Tax=Dactylosporangium sp. CA-152071 TaxID=3239933 RepID=UPI003D8FB89E
MSPKRSRTKARQQPDARPNTLAGLPDRDGNQPVAVSFRYADTEYSGAWMWFTDKEAGILLHFLRDIGQRSWRDVTHWREGNRLIHHEQSIDTICPEAQQRIAELGHDQRVDSLFRFGMGYTERLWGFVTANVFYVLWWDANHKVCPFDE